MLPRIFLPLCVHTRQVDTIHVHVSPGTCTHACTCTVCKCVCVCLCVYARVLCNTWLFSWLFFYLPTNLQLVYQLRSTYLRWWVKCGGTTWLFLINNLLASFGSNYTWFISCFKRDKPWLGTGLVAYVRFLYHLLDLFAEQGKGGEAGCSSLHVTFNALYLWSSCMWPCGFFSSCVYSLVWCAGSVACLIRYRECRIIPRHRVLLGSPVDFRLTWCQYISCCGLASLKYKTAVVSWLTGAGCDTPLT